MAYGTRKVFFILGAQLLGFCNCLISLEVLHKQVMITTTQIVPASHFGQDCALGLRKLMSGMDFYVRMNHSTATVTYMTSLVFSWNKQKVTKISSSDLRIVPYIPNITKITRLA